MVDSPLWLHQLSAIEKAKSLNEMALFFQVGTGKTRTTIEILRHNYNKHKKILRTFVICPKSVMGNWKNEIFKFSKIPAAHVFLLEGTLDKRISLLSKCPENSIFIMNYESFAFDKFVKATLMNPPNILICDESHRVKGIQAKRTKNLIKLSQSMKAKADLAHEPIYRYILTGTPVLQNMMDLFSQFQILDCGNTLGSNYFAYRATYFYDKNAFMSKQKHFPNWQPKPNSEEKLKDLIASKVVLANKDECLDLPPLVKTELEVELSPEQKRHYLEMKKEFITFCESGVVTAQLAITKALRMQQILSGYLQLESGDIVKIEENHRASALEELLEDITPTEKVIIWSIFHYDYEMIKGICKKLNLKYAEVTGLVKDKQKELDSFEKDPEVRVMIASPKAGGVGVNMIEASTMIYYSRSYSLEDDIQSEARCYRGGSEKHKKITRIDLVARGTVDELVLKALREKKNLADRILDLKDLL